MQEVVIQLLEESEYTAFDDSAEPKAFIGKDFEDCVITCRYNRDELETFANEGNAKTEAVMQLYGKVVRVYDSAFKDAILIICHQISTTKELDESGLKNTILRIEENKYGLRAYVLPYTISAAEKIAEAQQETNLTRTLVMTLRKGQGSLESRLADETYFGITQLFTKLPFLQIGLLSSGRAIESLDAQLDKAIGPSNKMKDLIINRSLDEINQLDVEDFLSDYSKLKEHDL